METPATPKRRTRIKQALFSSRKKDKDAVQSAKSPPQPSPSNPVNATETYSLGRIAHFTSPSRRKNGEVYSPPRPPNAWILYRRDKMRSITAASQSYSDDCIDRSTAAEERTASSEEDGNRAPPIIQQAQVSRMVSNMWKNETPFMRAEYARLAESYKAMHREQFPDYKYSPRRKTKTNVDGGDDADDGDGEDDHDGDDAGRRSARESSPTASKLARKKSTGSLSSAVFSPDTMTLTPGKASKGALQRGLVRMKSTTELKAKEENDEASATLGPSPLPALHRTMSADVIRSVDASRQPTSKPPQQKRTRSSTRAPPVAGRIEIPSPTKRPGRKSSRGSAAKADADGDGATNELADAWKLFGAGDQSRSAATAASKQVGDEDEHVEELDEWRGDAQAPASARTFDGNGMFTPPTWRATPPTDGFATQQQHLHPSFEGTIVRPPSPTESNLLLTAFDKANAAASSTGAAMDADSAAQQASGAASVPAHYAAFSQPGAGAATGGGGGASTIDFASYYRRPSSEHGVRLNSISSSFAGSATSLGSAPPLYSLAWDNAGMRGGAPRNVNGGYAPSAASSNGSLLSLHSAPATTMPRSFDENSDNSHYLAALTASHNRLSPGESSAFSENYVAPSPSDTSSCAASLTNAFAAWPPPSSGAFIVPDAVRPGERYGSWSETGMAMPSPSEQMASAGFVRSNDDNSPFVPAQAQQERSTTEAFVVDANAINPPSSELWLSHHNHSAAMQHPGYAEQVYAQQVFASVPPFAITLAPHSAPASYVQSFPRFETLQHERQDEEAALLRDMQIDHYINGFGHDGANDAR